MTKNDIQKSNFILSKDRTDNGVAYKTNMPIIKCTCGFKILVVPDLKAMNCAIKNHAARHKKAIHGFEPDSLEEFLTQQILIVASKMSRQM